MRVEAPEATIEIPRVLEHRLGRLLGGPVEASAGEAGAGPGGAGVLVAGRIAGGSRFSLFLEESLVLAAAAVVLGSEPGSLDEAAPVFPSLASEIAEAVGAGAEVEDVRSVVAPPHAIGRRTVYRIACGAVTGQVSIDLEHESPAERRPSEVLLELELPFVVTLGSVELELAQIQQLDAGAVLPLGRAAEGPVSLVVGGRVVARGELVVVDGCFGVRVDSVETAERRLTTLARV